MGRETIEKGIENQYAPHFFKISLRCYDTKFTEILIEAVWQKDHSTVRATGKYWGAGWEYEKRYIETKGLMLNILEQLKQYAEENCNKFKIRLLIMKFIMEVLQLTIR